MSVLLQRHIWSPVLSTVSLGSPKGFSLSLQVHFNLYHSTLLRQCVRAMPRGFWNAFVLLIIEESVTHLRWQA